MTDFADGEGISRYPAQAASPNVRGWVVRKVRAADRLRPGAKPRARRETAIE
jgi:hypothetical protein